MAAVIVFTLILGTEKNKKKVNRYSLGEIFRYSRALEMRLHFLNVKILNSLCFFAEGVLGRHETSLSRTVVFNYQHQRY